MKILDRYVLSSILKTSIIATVVFSLILAGVELFQKMDSILTDSLLLSDVIRYAFLCIPKYFIMVFSISLLFGSTYFQSSLSANNERIALLNAGVNKYRLFRPVFLLAVVLTFLCFILSETLIKDLEIKRTRLSEELFGTSSTQDSRNIVLKGENGWVIYTRRFSEEENTILSPILIRENGGVLEKRINAERGTYSSDDSCWILTDVTLYEKDESGSLVMRKLGEYRPEDFHMEPEYFRSDNINVETMNLSWAFGYLRKLETTNRESWAEKCTDYLRRFFQPLSVFLLLSISALFDYNLKKNVLLFSIIESLCVAVVYYVSDMVFSIAAHQGAISPVMAVILPVVTTVMLSIVINEFGRRI